MPLESIKKVVSVAARLGNVAGRTLEDGKVSFTDLKELPEMARVFVDLVAVDWRLVIESCQKLTAPDCEALVAHFKAEFKLPQTGLEIKIEEVLTIIIKTADLFISLIETLRR